MVSENPAIVSALSESRYLVVPAKRICARDSNIDIIIVCRPPVLSNPTDSDPINVFRGVSIDVDTPDTTARRTAGNRMWHGDYTLLSVDTSGEFPMEEVERLVFDADPCASPGKAAFVCVTCRDWTQGGLSLFTRSDLECRQSSGRRRSLSRRNIRASLSPTAASRERDYQTSNCNLLTCRKDGFPQSHFMSSSWTRGETLATEPTDHSTRPRQECRASASITPKVEMFPLIHPGSGSYPSPESGSCIQRKARHTDPRLMLARQSLGKIVALCQGRSILEVHHVIHGRRCRRGQSR